MTRSASILMAALAFASPASAQFEQCGSYRDAIDKLAAGVDVDHQVLVLSDVGGTGYCFALFVAGTSRMNQFAFDQFVKRFESSRADKEESSAGGGNGETSVVAQGPAAKVLSAAVEYGALTQGVDGQVITLRGNLAGVPSALVQKSIFPYCADGTSASEFCVPNSVLSWLRRASFSLSFDAARGSQVVGAPTQASGADAQPVTFTAQRNQISAGSVRLEILNTRDVTSPDFQDLWKQKVGVAMAKPSGELFMSAAAFAEPILNLPEYNEWHQRTVEALRAAVPDRSRLIAALRTRLDQLVVLARTANPDLQTAATDALAGYSRFFQAQDELISSLATKNVVALEYTFRRPIDQVESHNFRLIVDLPLTTDTKVVVNAAATLYGRLPIGAPPDLPTYRDTQAGVQLDHGLGSHSIIGPAVVSLAGYYQFQHAAALLEIDPLNPLPGIVFTGLPANAKTVFTKTGNIWLGQAKLALAPPGSSVKIPLSLTLSNRTELIDKPTWRAQVGVAYDLDSLLGSLGSRK